jgi:hypothetical protein
MRRRPMLWMRIVWRHIARIGKHIMLCNDSWPRTRRRLRGGTFPIMCSFHWCDTPNMKLAICWNQRMKLRNKNKPSFWRNMPVAAVAPPWRTRPHHRLGPFEVTPFLLGPSCPLFPRCTWPTSSWKRFYCQSRKTTMLPNQDCPRRLWRNPTLYNCWPIWRTC